MIGWKSGLRSCRIRSAPHLCYSPTLPMSAPRPPPISLKLAMLPFLTRLNPALAIDHMYRPLFRSRTKASYCSYSGLDLRRFLSTNLSSKTMRRRA